MTPHLEESTIIPIAPEFSEFVSAAMLRLKYLFPSLEFSADSVGIKVVGPGISDPSIAREISYQVYREKIFRETLPLRRSLYEMLAI